MLPIKNALGNMWEISEFKSALSELAHGLPHQYNAGLSSFFGFLLLVFFKREWYNFIFFFSHIPICTGFCNLCTVIWYENGINKWWKLFKRLKISGFTLPFYGFINKMAYSYLYLLDKHWTRITHEMRVTIKNAEMALRCPLNKIT